MSWSEECTAGACLSFRWPCIICFLLLSDYLKRFLSNSAEMLQHDSSQFPLLIRFGVGVASWVTDLRNSCLYMFMLRGDSVLRTSVTLIKCLQKESWPCVCLCPERCWDEWLLSSQPACENSLAFLRTNLSAHWIWTCPSSARKASWLEKHLPGPLPRCRCWPCSTCSRKRLLMRFFFFFLSIFFRTLCAQCCHACTYACNDLVTN